MADSLYEYEELAKLSRPPAPTVDDEGDVLSVGVDGEGRPRYQLDPPPGGISSWDDIPDKPSTFPPSAHTHEIADVTGLAAIVTPPLYPNGSSQDINWANGLWQSITASGNLALSFTGTPPVGAALRIRITASGADRTVTFPAGVIFDYDVSAVTVASGFTKTFYGVWDGMAYEFGYGPDRGAL